MSEWDFCDCWEPIETAPKDETFILLWDRQWTRPVVACWVKTLKGGYWAIDLSSQESDEPTHWMSLPSPPRDEARLKK